MEQKQPTVFFRTAINRIEHKDMIEQAFACSIFRRKKEDCGQGF